MKLISNIKKAYKLIKHFEQCRKEHLQMLDRHIVFLKELESFMKTKAK